MTFDSLFVHLPALVIAIPLLGAFLTPIIHKFMPQLRDMWVTAAFALTEVMVLMLAWDIYNDGARIYTFGGSSSTLIMPSGATVPVRIIFNIDALSILMASVSCTIGLIALVYSFSFVKKYTGLDKFYTLLLLMLVGMLGLVLTGDLFNLFVFFEILSIASAALIAFRDDRPEGFEAGLKYLTISVIGGLFILLAIGIFYGQYGHLNIAVIAKSMATSAEPYGQLDRLALVLLLVVFAMKCGTVPMHMWTPDAYSESPAPVTIMLVAASQASLYALLRTMFTMYGQTLDTVLVGWVIILLGIFSMFVGVTMALVQRDLKRFVGYAAVSQTGYMLLAVGVGLATLGESDAELLNAGYSALTGGIFHIMNEIFTMGLLFLAAGAVYHRTGTRDLNQMGGLAHSMGWTSVFFLIGGLALSGIPPFNGFASKWIIYESVFRFNPILAAIGMAVSLITLAAVAKVYYAVFMGPPMKRFAHVKEVPSTMLMAMGALSVIIIFIGLFPNLIVTNTIEPAVTALLDQAGYLKRVAQVIGGGV